MEGKMFGHGLSKVDDGANDNAWKILAVLPAAAAVAGIITTTILNVLC